MEEAVARLNLLVEENNPVGFKEFFLSINNEIVAQVWVNFLALSGANKKFVITHFKGDSEINTKICIAYGITYTTDMGANKYTA